MTGELRCGYITSMHSNPHAAWVITIGRATIAWEQSLWHLTGGTSIGPAVNANKTVTCPRADRVVG